MKLRGDAKISKIAAMRWGQVSKKIERDLEGVVRKWRQPRDGVRAQRFWHKGNRVRSTVVTPIQWAVTHVFGWASKAVINQTDFRSLGSNYIDAFFGTSKFNSLGLVEDRMNVHAPVRRLARIDP